jgi:hypothetical protein
MMFFAAAEGAHVPLMPQGNQRLGTPSTRR